MFSATYETRRNRNNSEEIMIPEVEVEHGFFDNAGGTSASRYRDEGLDEGEQAGAFDPLGLSQGSILGNMLDYFMSFTNVGLDFACAAVSAIGSARSAGFADETPITVRVLCFIGGFTMMMSGFMSIVNLFTLITSPSTYIIQAYQCVFGVAAMFIEAQEWHAFANIKPWMHHWCRFLTVLGGRGAFYLFTGTLGLSVWASGVYSTAMGLYMATMGVVCLMVATRNVMSASKMQDVPSLISGTELCYDDVGEDSGYMTRYAPPQRHHHAGMLGGGREDNDGVGYHDVNNDFMGAAPSEAAPPRHHHFGGRHPSAEATTAASSSSFENPSTNSLGPSYRRGGLPAHPLNLHEDEEDITAAAAASLNMRPPPSKGGSSSSFNKLSSAQSSTAGAANRSPVMF